MRWMKRFLTGCAVLMLMLSCAASAFAMEVPTATIVRNLNGVQEYIKIYTVSPETNAADLIEPSFEYNGYTYNYTEIVKAEDTYSNTKSHTETVVVETEKNDLDSVLAALEPSIEYDDGVWHGVLNLDHASIKTEATSQESRSYTITEVKRIDNLSSNDMSLVPSATVKDGVTLQLKNVDWQVQSTDLVDDILVPASYVAVATYSGTGWYSSAAGYISTAEYVGNVTSEGIGSITYTITYTGTPTSLVDRTSTSEPGQESKQEQETVRAPTITPVPETETASDGFLHGFNWLWIAGGALLLIVLIVGILLIRVLRRHGEHEPKYYETEDNRYGN